MRLTVALLFATVGYTLAYAGIKGGPGGQWARAPWLLWVQAFAELQKEATAARSLVGQGPPGARTPLPAGVQGPVWTVPAGTVAGG